MNEPRDSFAWDYLRKRDLSEETAIRFMLGYAKRDHGLFEYLYKKKGYSIKEILDTKLCFKPYPEIKEWFSSQRLIMPIRDGSLVRNISSRLMVDSNIRPPYKHMINNKFTFYEPTSVKHREDLFLCEGQIDRLTLEQAKLNSVSLLGTSGAAQRFITTMNWANRIFCIPDAEDNPLAWKANIRTYIKIKQGLSGDIRPDVLVINLPRKGKEKVDPNSLFNGWNPEDVKNFVYDELVKSAIPIEDFKEWKDIAEARDKGKKRKEKSDQIRAEGEKILSVPIVEVLETVLNCELEPRGQEYICSCINPQHEDSRPSLRVYPQTNTFYCWTCKEWGDQIGAVSLALNLSWKEASALIKERLGNGD